MQKPDSLFYVVGIIALVFFFSPFVMIYVMVKGVNKIAVLLKHRVPKAEVAENLTAQDGTAQSLRLGAR